MSSITTSDRDFQKTLCSMQSRLNDYLTLRGYSTRFSGEPKKQDMKKLSHLNPAQLAEFVADVYDEISRRSNNRENQPYLQAVKDYSPKRNQARQRLANLVPKRFEQLVSNLIQEIEQRYAPDDPLTSPSSIQTQQVTPSIESVSVKGPATPFCNSKIKEYSQKQEAFNFEYLDKLIQDLNNIIGKEQNAEAEQLKMRHAQEIQSLKEHVEKLEQVTLPEKDREIATLVCQLNNTRQELAQCNHTFANNNQAIQEREIPIESLQNAYNQLQPQQMPNIQREPSKGLLLQQEKSHHALTPNADEFWETYTNLARNAADSISRAAPNNEILSCVKESCSFAQKIVKNFDGHGQAENLYAAKKDCLQSVSHVIACCKDLGSHKSAPAILQQALSEQTNTIRGLLERSLDFQPQMDDTEPSAATSQPLNMNNADFEAFYHVLQNKAAEISGMAQALFLALDGKSCSSRYRLSGQQLLDTDKMIGQIVVLLYCGVSVADMVNEPLKETLSHLEQSSKNLRELTAAHSGLLKDSAAVKSVRNSLRQIINSIDSLCSQLNISLASIGE